jgi:hypothetical protein
LVPVALAELLV